MYVIIDLEACYDRQLASIGSILEESAEINRSVVRLVTSILPIFKYHICTGFGISKNSYGNKD